MPGKAPRVIDGLRSPEDRTKGVNIDSQKAAELLHGIHPLEQRAIEIAQEKRPAKLAKTIRRFQSKFPNYRVQITSPSDSFDPISGIVRRARPIVAQFREGIYSPDTDKTVEDADLVDMRLRESDYFGIGNDFWDAADLAQASQEASIRQLLELVKSAPAEEQARVVEALRPKTGAKTFEEPQAAA